MVRAGYGISRLTRFDRLPEKKLPPRRGLGQAMPPSRRAFSRSGGLGGWRCGRFKIGWCFLVVRKVHTSYQIYPVQ